MSLILLIIGSVLTLAFILLLISGQKFNYLVENLDSGDFPMSFIYCVGIALQQIPLLAHPGKLGDKIRENAKLVYSRKYSEYYARIIWAQALSFGLICAAVCFVLAGIMTDMAGFMGLIGVVMAILPGYYFISHLQEQVTKRRDACEKELPNAISKMALLVNSGIILHEAWEIVSEGNEGEFYELMRRSCEDMRNGRSDLEAIYEFGVASSSEDVKKFTSALVQSIERGGGELPSFLSNQSKELWSHRRQVVLQKGEKAAGALLMPIALMFLGVMLIVISAAMQSFGM